MEVSAAAMFIVFVLKEKKTFINLMVFLLYIQVHYMYAY